MNPCGGGTPWVGKHALRNCYRPRYTPANILPSVSEHTVLGDASSIFNQRMNDDENRKQKFMQTQNVVCMTTALWKSGWQIFDSVQKDCVWYNIDLVWYSNGQISHRVVTFYFGAREEKSRWRITFGMWMLKQKTLHTDFRYIRVSSSVCISEFVSQSSSSAPYSMVLFEIANRFSIEILREYQRQPTCKAE